MNRKPFDMIEHQAEPFECESLRAVTVDCFGSQSEDFQPSDVDQDINENFRSRMNRSGILVRPVQELLEGEEDPLSKMQIL